MKVALCVSGHFRTFKKCEDSWFRCIIDIHDPDVFIHTWDDLGFSRNVAIKQEYDAPAKELVARNKKYGNSKGEFYRGTPPIGDIYKNLEPKKIVIESYQDVENEIYQFADTIKKKHEYDYPPSLISQLRKINLANKLKKEYEEENNFTYDIVIRIRPDVIFFYDLVIKNPEIVHTPLAYSYKIISDIFAYSTSSNMDKYCSLYERLGEYRDREEVYFNPHELLKYHLEQEKLEYIIDNELALDLERNKTGIT